MKRPKKILIVLVTLSAIVGGGFLAINKYNENLQKQYQAQEPKEEVKKGNLEVNVTSYGNVLVKNENNTSDLKVQINIDELDINKVKIGQKVKIKSKSSSNEIIEGRVEYISQIGDIENGKTKYKVDISIEKPILKIGTIKYDEVNLREGISKEFLLTTKLNSGTKVEILNEAIKPNNEKWYEISLEDGTIGWVYSQNINIDGINKNNVVATIKSDGTNANEKASSSSSVVAKLAKGDEVTIIEKEGSYYKVKLGNEQEGYIKESELMVGNLKPGMSVTASILVDKKEDTLYIPIQCVTKGDKGYSVIPYNSNDYKNIEVGISSEDYVEVLKGLSAGDKIKVLNQESKN
ncbi:cell wall-associated hydrolase, invasion-associated protein,Uncharacterized protein conserved in bacteria,efflux transporter, RND family, MFP subunit,Bacterial SH3 domain [[Clostridium] sordellii]|uniref:SH3 domain-containing protein n=2 Tax=Paraclostridium sordellii TaxID=1505 RepID=UPI000543E58F|nr:SH3 domain-containing protein [Paeniclostridium sordellii]CEK33864.1 cell wall-associated hydrolase, invasion-associated protein,Uncharacterized protein conserved in bacteria,efflux transporter, RND family, MFP subunit,Bacterial SH3 domain [[Clostridium] sordellii] [Paeniclostridium sordellii]